MEHMVNNLQIFINKEFGIIEVLTLDERLRNEYVYRFGFLLGISIKEYNMIVAEINRSRG